MKGLEYQTIFGILLVIAVIVLVVLIVVGPSLSFGKSTSSAQSFDEFCVFWSLSNYNTNIDTVTVGSAQEKISDMCSSYPDTETCIKCCKKEIAC